MCAKISWSDVSPSLGCFANLESKLRSFLQTQPSQVEVVESNDRGAGDSRNDRTIADDECSDDECEVSRDPISTGRDPSGVDTNNDGDRSQYQEHNDDRHQSRGIRRGNLRNCTRKCAWGCAGGCRHRRQQGLLRGLEVCVLEMELLPFDAGTTTTTEVLGRRGLEAKSSIIIIIIILVGKHGCWLSSLKCCVSERSGEWHNLLYAAKKRAVSGAWRAFHAASAKSQNNSPWNQPSCIGCLFLPSCKLEVGKTPANSCSCLLVLELPSADTFTAQYVASEERAAWATWNDPMRLSLPCGRSDACAPLGRRRLNSTERHRAGRCHLDSQWIRKTGLLTYANQHGMPLAWTLPSTP